MKLENTIHYCTLCQEDEEESIATHYCNNCNQNLCNLHVQLHNKKKLNKDHHLTNLLPEQQEEEEKQQILSTSTSPSTTTSSNSSNVIYKEHHYCKHHEGLVTDIYCKGCDNVICSKCAAFNHKQHDYVDINEIVKEEKEKMKPLIEDLQLKKEILLQRINEIKLTTIKIKEQANVINNDIDILFTELQKLLIEKKEKLTLELNEIVKNKLNTLQNEETLLNEHYNNCNELCQLNNNNIEIFQNKINLKLKKEVNDLNELNVINNLEFMSHIKLRIDKDKLINLINDNLDNLDNYRISIDKILFNKNEQIVKNDFNLIKFQEITKFEGNENLKLFNPQDIIYNNNLIYIADTSNDRVLILDNLFNYKNEIKLFSPYSLAINNNYLFIGCPTSIYKYNLNTLQLINEIKSNENYELKSVNVMTLDKDNNLYICNENNNEIIILNENNEFIRKFKTNNNLKPRRITINNKDQIVITFEKEIQVFDKLGNFILNVKFNDYNLNGIICDDLNNYIVCNKFLSHLLLLDSNFNLIKKNNSFPCSDGISLNKLNNQIYLLHYNSITLCK